VFRLLGWIAVLALVLTPAPALAWGPLAHIYLASSLVQDLLPVVNAPLASLLSKHLTDFLYGTPAADAILVKNARTFLHNWHNWRRAIALFAHAEDEPTEAFLYGYLAHLGADVVAHNAFVPLKRIEGYDGPAPTHVMLEVHADRVLRGRGDVARLFREVVRADRKAHDAFLGRFVFGTIIKDFHKNKRVFDRVVSLQTWERWERVTSYAGDVARRPLAEEDLQVFVDVAAEVSALLFRSPLDNPLGHVDPSGALAQAIAKGARDELSRLWGMGALDSVDPLDVRLAFEPVFLDIARGERITVPNLSELFAFIVRGEQPRPRTKTLLARVVGRARARRRARKDGQKKEG